MKRNRKPQNDRNKSFSKRSRRDLKTLNNMIHKNRTGRIWRCCMMRDMMASWRFRFGRKTVSPTRGTTMSSEHTATLFWTTHKQIARWIASKTVADQELNLQRYSWNRMMIKNVRQIVDLDVGRVTDEMKILVGVERTILMNKQNKIKFIGSWSTMLHQQLKDSRFKTDKIKKRTAKRSC